MRKSFKILLITSSICIIFLISLTGVVGVIIHKVMEKEMDQDLPFLQSLKMVLALDYDSEKEIKLKEERNLEQHHHISIYYPDDFTELVPLTKETLNWAIKKNQELFGEVKEVPLDFIIVKDYEELEGLSGIVDISGFYSDFDKIMAITYHDKDSLLAQKETPLYFFQKTILHEYTHYILARMTNDSSKGFSLYPTWFREGVSEYVGNDQTNVDYSGFRLIPLVELDTQEQWQVARLQDEADVYNQSYFAINYLVDTFGTGIIKKILDETNSTENFEQGFLKATDLTVTNFEKNFSDAIEMER